MMDKTQIAGLAAAIKNIYERGVRYESELLEVNPKELDILRQVSRAGSIKLKELAEQTGLPLSTCGWIVERLVKNGLLARKTDEKDRRAISLSLAPQGAETIAKYEGIFNKISEVALALLAEDEQQQIVRIMEKVNQLFPGKTNQNGR